MLYWDERQKQLTHDDYEAEHQAYLAWLVDNKAELPVEPSAESAVEAYRLSRQFAPTVTRSISIRSSGQTVLQSLVQSPIIPGQKPSDVWGIIMEDVDSRLPTDAHIRQVVKDKIA
jgi:hypothetical protein